MNTFENGNIREGAEKATAIHLRFSRHEKKASSDDGMDSKIPLTEAGRIDAKNSAPLRDISQAMAYGSPRQRALETAALELFGQQSDISSKETLEELDDRVAANLGSAVPKKVLAKKELDFTFEDDSAYGTWLMDHYMRMKDYTRALLLESDAKRAELIAQGDEAALAAESASVYAKQVATHILRYVRASQRWHELVNDPSKEYEPTLTRFVVAHGGRYESFLGVLLKRLYGHEELERFIDAVPNGFTYHEGFDVNIESNGGDTVSVRIKYERPATEDRAAFTFDAEVPVEMLEQIAAE